MKVLGFGEVSGEVGYPKVQVTLQEDPPSSRLSKWGVYRCPSLSEVKHSETVAQGRQDTLLDTGKSTNCYWRKSLIRQMHRKS